MPRMMKPSQMTAMHKPLTQKDIDRVCSLLRDLGDRIPEDLKCTEGEILSLMDSGAVPNVANQPKHFPGADVEESEAQKAGAVYRTATGQPFPNKGQMTIPCTTQEGHRKTFVFQNADVTLPILSTSNMADSDNDILYQKHGGKVAEVSTNKFSEFDRHGNVYFMKVYLKKQAFRKPKPGFARPGVRA